MATTQKVTAVLRKAGVTFSKFHRSGMVRGWGTTSRGYSTSRSYDDKELIIVEYELGSDSSRRLNQAERLQRSAEAIGKVVDTLRNAGLTVEQKSSDWKHWLEVR